MLLVPLSEFQWRPVVAADYPQEVASVSEEPRMYRFSSPELGITREHPGVQGVITAGDHRPLATA